MDNKARLVERLQMKKKRKDYPVSPEVGKRITQTAFGLEGLMQNGQSWRRPLPPNWTKKKYPNA